MSYIYFIFNLTLLVIYSFRIDRYTCFTISFLCLFLGTGAFRSTPQLRPVLETANLRCFSSASSHSSNRFRMPTRASEMKSSGFEGKGLVLLLICGFYAVILFLIARVFAFAMSRVTSTGKLGFQPYVYLSTVANLLYSLWSL